MKYLRIENGTRSGVVATRVGLADRWWLRARGYLGRPAPAPGEGLLLSPCRAVHMMGMRYPLDVVVLDRDRRVIALYPGLEPGQRTAFHRQARYVLELGPGAIVSADLRVGDGVRWAAAEAVA